MILKQHCHMIDDRRGPECKSLMVYKAWKRQWGNDLFNEEWWLI